MSRRKGWQGCMAGCIFGGYILGGVCLGYGPPGGAGPAWVKGNRPEFKCRGVDLLGLKARPDSGESRPGGGREGNPMHQVVAYLELPGTQERYVITAGAQVIRITGSGELSVVGVVTDPGETPFLCLIRTARLVLGVWSDGRLVDTASGFLLGRVVALGGAGSPQPEAPRPEPESGTEAEPHTGPQVDSKSCPGRAHSPGREQGRCPGSLPRL